MNYTQYAPRNWLLRGIYFSLFSFFLANSTSSSITDSFVMVSPVLYMSLAQKKESLFEAAKSGDSDVNEIRLKDGGYYCYCAYILRTSRYSGFLSVMLTNTEIFLQGLKLSGETGSY